MSSWITSRFIERTLRVLGHISLAAAVSVALGVLYLAFDSWPLDGSEVVTALLIAALSSLPPIVFYWLAHFLRLRREDKPEGGKHKGATA